MELRSRLEAQVLAELDFCDSETSPLICFNISDDVKKEQIVKTIIETVMSRKIDIQEAIVEVERLFSNIDFD